MSKSRAQEVANLTPENQRRYSTYRSWSIFLGVVSLFSFWIMVLVNEIIPWDGPTYSLGSMARLMEWAPAGLILALAAFVASLWLMGMARDLRKNYSPSSAKPEE